MKGTKSRNNNKKQNKPLTQNEIMKWEIAQELGLAHKIIDGDWSKLTAAESGRIGGILSRRKKHMKEQEQTQGEGIAEEDT